MRATIQPARVTSIDALRGLTIAFMILVNDPGDWRHVYWPLDHAEWNGFTPTDLVFPTFLFLVGCSIVFSVRARLAKGVPTQTIAFSIVRRALTIFALKIFVSAYPHFHMTHLRLYGVLTRIALCYLATGLIFLYVRSVKALAIIAIALIVGYWLLLRFVPVPGAGMPVRDFPINDPVNNLTAWMDRGVNAWSQHRLHMGRLYLKTSDPEGLLSTLPSIATTLLGVLAALWMRSLRTAATIRRPGRVPHQHRRHHTQPRHQIAQRRRHIRQGHAIGRRRPGKPMPRQIHAITSKSRASAGISVRHECVAEPVPCANSTTGPAPIRCTCQCSAPRRTNELASLFGQSPPSRAQSITRPPPAAPPPPTRPTPQQAGPDTSPPPPQPTRARTDAAAPPYPPAAPRAPPPARPAPPVIASASATPRPCPPSSATFGRPSVRNTATGVCPPRFTPSAITIAANKARRQRRPPAPGIPASDRLARARDDVGGSNTSAALPRIDSSATRSRRT